MFKNLIVVLLVILFFIIAPAGVYFLSYSQAAYNTNDQKVKYNLPYPGILPDNPLYFVKSTRDKILELITRDNIKKAQLYRLFSDKKASMVLTLEKKGREKLAVQTMLKAEKDAVKLAKALKLAKKQGVAPEGEFIQLVKLSNEKHREVIDILRKELPQDESADTIREIIEINSNVKKDLSTL